MNGDRADPRFPRVDRALVAHMRRAQLRRRRAAGTTLGGGQTRIKGRGLEYVESRAYEPGDDVRHIDWAVTARTGVPHTKLYHEEHVRRLLCYVDVSDSMRFGGRRRSKLETALSAAAALAGAALAARDHVEVVAFSDRVTQRFAPVRREGDLWRLVGDFEAIPHAPGSTPTASDVAAIAADFAGRQRLPDVVFVLSDFHGFADGAAPLWHDDVRPLQVLSQLECVPPGIRLMLRDCERGGAATMGQRTVTPHERLWGRPVVVLDDETDLAAPLRRALRGTARWR